MTVTDEPGREPGTLEYDDIPVRTLTVEDLRAVVAIDRSWTGVSRRDFYEARIRRSLEESSMQLSVGAVLDGMLVGFLTVSFFGGEFGLPDRTAVLDAIGVHEDYRGRRVAAAMLRQVELNLRALLVDDIRTDVAWDNFGLLEFLARSGFEPAPRLSLHKALGAACPRLSGPVSDGTARTGQSHRG